MFGHSIFNKMLLLHLIYVANQLSAGNLHRESVAETKLSTNPYNTVVDDEDFDFTEGSSHGSGDSIYIDREAGYVQNTLEIPIGKDEGVNEGEIDVVDDEDFTEGSADGSEISTNNPEAAYGQYTLEPSNEDEDDVNEVDETNEGSADVSWDSIYNPETVHVQNTLEIPTGKDEGINEVDEINSKLKYLLDKWKLHYNTVVDDEDFTEGSAHGNEISTNNPEAVYTQYESSGEDEGVNENEETNGKHLDPLGKRILYYTKVYNNVVVDDEDLTEGSADGSGDSIYKLETGYVQNTLESPIGEDAGVSDADEINGELIDRLHKTKLRYTKHYITVIDDEDFDFAEGSADGS